MNDAHTQLTVCAIGRNEGDHLRRLAESLDSLKKRVPATETLFVDSASEDDSVAIARPLFDTTLVLEKSPNLSASAGRYAGTLAASGDWILYLDGDMTLEPEFTEAVPYLLESPTHIAGWSGYYRYEYDNGRKRLVKGFTTSRGVRRHFGGAVMLRRSDVLAAGNWNPGIFSNEEIELYTRIRATGRVVHHFPGPMIAHYTKWIPRLDMLVGSFVPNATLGKKFYGLGQVLAARHQRGQMLDLIRFFPYPFALWSAAAAGGVLGALGHPGAGLTLTGATALWIGIVRGFTSLLFCSSFPAQALLGFSRYDDNYVPKVAASFSNSRRKVETGQLLCAE